MSGILLGIDFGTGGAKACLMSDQGEVLAYAYREYEILVPVAGWSEHDPENYWSVTCQLISEILDRAGVPSSNISGVGLSCALPSMVMVDESGNPVAPALNLMDRRALKEVEHTRSLLGDSLIENLTANRIEDHPTIVNLLWFKKHKPDVFAATHKALTIDGFIAARLTSTFAVNRSAAVFYGVAFDIRSGEFRQEVLERVGIPPTLIPDVCDCVDVIGTVTTAAAAETGLTPGTPLVGGQVDCNAGWIAGGAIEAGDMQLNLGTCGVLGVVHQREDYLSHPDGLQMVNIPYTTSPGDTFSAVAVTTTGGQTLRYLRDTFGGIELETERLTGISAYELLTSQARDITPGSDGLIVMPYFMGERSPLWDASARGVVFGLSLHHTRGHVLRAFMEGVAYALYYSFSTLMKTGLPARHPLVFNEGGAQSAVWRRIITDVLGVPTARLEGVGGAPLGDAILAGVGVGLLADFGVAREWARHVDHCEPIAENHERYMEYFAVYRGLYDDVEKRFRDLHRLVGG